MQQTSFQYRPVISFALLWAACMLVTLVAAWLLGVSPAGIDDAWIFFVYADNFSAGEGLVYNAGSEPVEGFSSIAWTLLLSLLFRLGLGSWLPIMLLSSALAAAGLFALCRSFRFGLDGSTAARTWLLLFGVWMLASPGWFLWNVASFMDLVLWGCLLGSFVGFYIHQVYAPSDKQPGPVMAMLLALMLLTRPEAMVWVPFFLAALYLLAIRRRGQVSAYVGVPALASALTLAALTLFRLSYFGDPLPNTYYAKVSPDFFYNLVAGGEYLIEYVTGAGFAGLAMLLAVLVCVRQLPRLISLVAVAGEQPSPERYTSVFLAWCLLIALMVTAVEGGDHFGGARLMQPVYPLAFLFVAYTVMDLTPASVQRINSSGSGWLIATVALILFAAPLRASWYNVDRTGLVTEFEVASEGRATARSLMRVLDAAGITEMPGVGVTGAGGFRFEWSGAVFDLMGLNDRELAHDQGDRKGYSGHEAFSTEVFFRRQPEIMLPHTEGWPRLVQNCRELQEAESFYWTVLDGLPGNPEFTENYNLVSVLQDDARLCMFVRKDYLEGLRKAGVHLSDGR